MEPCEGPSFSQRLQVSDADETNCSLMNHSSHAIYTADTLVDIRKPALLECILDTQMEKLEITKGSDDLFDYPSGTGGSKISLPLAPNGQEIAVAQEYVISDLSQGIEHLVLGVGLDASEQYDNPNKSIVSISSKDTIREPTQLSTRSSLESDDVYDVITLSDSDQEEDVPIPRSMAESPSLHYNMSDVNSQSLVPISSDLSTMAQNRLDRFFDNIPLINSKGLEESKTSVNLANQTHSDVADENSISSVYISETDEEDQSDANACSENGAIDEKNHSQDHIFANNKCESPKSTCVPNTQSTQVTKSKYYFLNQFKCILKCLIISASCNTNRTPVVNISAKFQIRIQVAGATDYSSSECSSKLSSPRNATTENAPQPPTDLMSELCIVSDSNSSDGSLMGNQLPAASGINSDNQSQSSISLAGAQVTPKSNTRKLQQEKMRIPVVNKKISTNKNNTPEVRDALNPPGIVNQPVKQIVLDDGDQKLLNELYGSSWQTPELMKKCIIRNPHTVTKTNADMPPPSRTKRGLFAQKTCTSTSNEKPGTFELEKNDISRISQDFSMCKCFPR